ncbi:hypothetical protein EYF80_016275 [Liparis tanakae]|uniref:Uncharacterized protein n=1 Tax=Liparis tanakae TaxID=230148 RepID=A0A4Z2I7P7_9TELE|nr:hypothetical protein EYF80_016275 [Liparis tanakae]
MSAFISVPCGSSSREALLHVGLILHTAAPPGERDRLSDQSVAVSKWAPGHRPISPRIPGPSQPESTPYLNMKELIFKNSDWLLETNIKSVQVKVRGLVPVPQMFTAGGACGAQS